MTIYTLPRIFWDDHFDRCAEHPGKRKEIKRGRNTVTVDLDCEALADLTSDASYYGDIKWSLDEIDPSIPRSARNTMRTLSKGAKT